MRVINFIKRIFTPTTETVTNTSLQNQGSNNNELSEELSTKNLQPGDNYNFTTTKKQKGYNRKLEIKRIRKEQDITFWDRACFRIKNLFKKDITEKAKQYIPNEKTATLKDWQNAGACIFKEILGDVSKLSDTEKGKRYKQVLEEFYMQLTMFDDNEIRNAILSGAISILKADSRYGAIQDFIKTGENETSINQRARDAQAYAEENIVTADGFGNRMSAEDATKYQYMTFANMNEFDVTLSLDELDARARELNEKENLTEYERAVKDLYVTSGYAGSYAGIYENSYINSANTEAYISRIHKTTAELGIQDAVEDRLNCFMKNEYKNNKQYQKDFYTTLNRITDKNNKISQTSDTKTNMYDDTEELPKTKQTQTTEEKNNPTPYNNKNASTEANTRNSQYTSQVIIRNNRTTDTKAESSNDKKEQKAEQNIYKTNQTAAKNELSMVIQNGTINDVLKYKKEHHVNLQKICFKILNNNVKDNFLNEFALNLFSSLNSSEQVKSFNTHQITSQSGQLAAASVMSASDLAKIKQFANIDVKNGIERMRIEKEKMEKEKSSNITFEDLSV